MKLNLSGTWQFALDEEKIGLQQEYYRRMTFEDTIDLPTTTAEEQKRKKRYRAAYRTFNRNVSF